MPRRNEEEELINTIPPPFDENYESEESYEEELVLNRRRPVCRYCHQRKQRGHMIRGACTRPVCLDELTCGRADLHKRPRTTTRNPIVTYVPHQAQVRVLPSVTGDTPATTTPISSDNTSNHERSIIQPIGTPVQGVPITTVNVTRHTTPNLQRTTTIDRQLGSIQIAQLDYLYSTLQSTMEQRIKDSLVDRRDREERERMLFLESNKRLERLLYVVIAALFFISILLIFKI